MPHLPTLRTRYSAAGGTFLTLVVFRDPVAHTVSTYRYMGTSKRRKPALSQWVREKGEESSSVYRAPSWGLQVAANLEVQRHTTRPTLHRSLLCPGRPPEAPRRRLPGYQPDPGLGRRGSTQAKSAVVDAAPDPRLARPSQVCPAGGSPGSGGFATACSSGKARGLRAADWLTRLLLRTFDVVATMDKLQNAVNRALACAGALPRRVVHVSPMSSGTAALPPAADLLQRRSAPARPIPSPAHDSSPAAVIAPRYPCGPPLSLSDSEMGLLRNFVQCDMTLFRAAAAAAQTQMGWPHAKGICRA